MMTDTHKYLLAFKLFAFAIGSVLSHFGYGAAPPTVEQGVALINDGSMAEFGPWFVTAETPWDKFLPTLDKYPWIILHNPGGNNPAWGETMMQLAQFRRMTEYAKAHPDDKDAQARADWPAFVRGMLARKAKGLWSGVYLGGFNFECYPSLPGETPKQYQVRVLKEWRPLIDAKPDAIFLDAEDGPMNADPLKWTAHEKVVYGDQGGSHLIVNYWLRLGVEVGIEPHTYVDYKLYHNRTILLQDVRWYSMEYRAAERDALGYVGRGDSTWDTGSHKARPVRHVNLHPRVFRKVDANRKTKAELLETVRLAREAGHIPVVPFVKIIPEMGLN